MRRLPLLFAAALVAVAVAGDVAASPNAAAPGSGNWMLFGRTGDQNRYSPLSQITRANVRSLERVFRIDFRELDPTIRRGQQSYPLAIDGTLYVTTNDNNVFAINGTTGRVIWRYTPPNRAVFANFGIVANRGVAACAGRLFLATLDMHLVALDRRTGRQLRRVAIADAVPGASPAFGYSETSAPMCVKNRIVIGAAGSEYGVRGFVMAWNPDLTPAWANPYWTVPPANRNWRRTSRIVGGGVVWTPVTIDGATNTVFFGTGSPTPLYWPQLRPGQNPRTNSLIAVDLLTGRQKWWRQQLSRNEWAYDTAQPPLVYDAPVGGARRRVVSVATMEGLWYAYDARTGRPLHQRVKVIDRTEHPRLRPGEPVVVYPSSLGGLNYSPASYHPGTGYVLNAAAETAAILIQKRLTPTEKRRKLLLGDVFLGLENGNFGQVLPSWRDHGSISAINVRTGRRVWKIRTPEPERGGVTTTAGGLGFAGGGDGVLRAFDVRNGRVLWTTKMNHPIASGSTIYSAGGRQYLAITVGGTPTSSNGGTASELHVFALPGARSLVSGKRVTATAAPAPAAVAAPTPVRSLAAAGGTARITTQRIVPIRSWTPAHANTPLVGGRVTLRGAPVAGARVRVGSFLVPRLTDRNGRFTYPIDVTAVRRYTVRVVGTSRATVGGRRLGAGDQAALRRVRGFFDVAYRVHDLRARVQANGTVAVSGRVTLAGGTAPPPVVLFTYQLTGRITDDGGRPVRGAVVVTRTLDRDFWTLSRPSDADGRYTSFFTASDKEGSNPLPMNVQVAVGDTAYATPADRTPRFTRLRSAVMDIRLPASGTVMAVPDTRAVTGAVHDGLLVGVSGRRGVIKPLSARWPDRRGRFSLVLPASARGQTLRIWQNHRQFFSTNAAVPGGAVDLDAWPSSLQGRIPQGLASVKPTSR